MLYNSRDKINEISNKIYKLFKEFETFKDAKWCRKINVFEDETNNKIKLHTKSFVKTYLIFMQQKYLILAKLLKLINMLFGL